MAARNEFRRRAAVLMLLIISLAAIGVMIVAVARMFAARRELQISQERHLQAALLAQAGVERGAALLANNPDYAGETWPVAAAQLGGKERAAVRITVPDGGAPAERIISAKAAYGDSAESAVKYTRTATIELTTP